MSISENFGISPFEIRRERFSEFCLLIIRLNQYKIEQEKRYHNGMLKRKAGDDWF
jgi:hypothetical protein